MSFYVLGEDSYELYQYLVNTCGAITSSFSRMALSRCTSLLSYFIVRRIMHSVTQSGLVHAGHWSRSPKDSPSSLPSSRWPRCHHPPTERLLIHTGPKYISELRECMRAMLLASQWGGACSFRMATPSSSLDDFRRVDLSKGVYAQMSRRLAKGQDNS
jgi:hypothetical protein